jgi:hypothetical protein
MLEFEDMSGFRSVCVEWFGRLLWEAALLPVGVVMRAGLLRLRGPALVKRAFGRSDAVEGIVNPFRAGRIANDVLVSVPVNGSVLRK